MPSWSEIVDESRQTLKTLPNGQQIIDFDRLFNKYISMFSTFRGRNVIVYYSDWLNPTKGPNIDINESDLIGFMNCVHGMDKSKGLDLILHTPGGNPLATEAIVKYLHKIFGDDIEVFIPHLAMSAGTMLSCSCKKIWMGKQSFLGPVDPQFGGVPAFNIKKEFEDAKKELIEKPDTFRNWQILLSKYAPAFYYTVLDAIKLSSKLVKDWLYEYMFKGEEDAKEKAEMVAKFLNVNTGSHNKHFDYSDCLSIGLKIEKLESDQDIQEMVLSIYHCCAICGSNTPMCKLISNQNKKSYVINGIINQGIK